VSWFHCCSTCMATASVDTIGTERSVFTSLLLAGGMGRVHATLPAIRRTIQCGRRPPESPAGTCPCHQATAARLLIYCDQATATFPPGYCKHAKRHCQSIISDAIASRMRRAYCYATLGRGCSRRGGRASSARTRTLRQAGEAGLLMIIIAACARAIGIHRRSSVGH
jgi:hypothetical protein